jgi:threonine aldolase
MIDFRSDTVTRPGPDMLRAMMSAEVGDDVFNEDPTVIRLEEKAAELFGMEAGLFCPSGTMTNQIALNVHTRPGDEVLCDKYSHIHLYEGGGMAANSGLSVTLLDGNRGRLSLDQVSGAVKGDDPHFPSTRLVSLENTSNKGGGSCYDFEDMKAISVICRTKSIGIHLDGARVFNAIVRKGYSPEDLGALFDSVSVCLSKGLGAPVGSVLLGKNEFVHQARRVRKRFGGGMRQAGYLAAAGIFALENNVSRMEEDHGRAAQLAQKLIELPYVKEVTPPETNIVVFRVADGYTTDGILASLKANGILAVPFGTDQIRMVLHLDITDDMMAEVDKKLVI